MQIIGDSSPDAVPVNIAAGLQLRAFSVDDQQQLLKSLSMDLVTSGGWLLRHRYPSRGILQVVFEFERSAAVEIYAMMVLLGLEFTSDSHAMLAGFCQRTAGLPRADTVKVALCDLEIRHLADEASSPEQLFGNSAIA